MAGNRGASLKSIFLIMVSREVFSALTLLLNLLVRTPLNCYGYTWHNGETFDIQPCWQIVKSAKYSVATKQFFKFQLGNINNYHQRFKL